MGAKKFGLAVGRGVEAGAPEQDEEVDRGDGCWLSGLVGTTRVDCLGGRTRGPGIGECH